MAYKGRPIKGKVTFRPKNTSYKTGGKTSRTRARFDERLRHKQAINKAKEARIKPISSRERVTNRKYQTIDTAIASAAGLGILNPTLNNVTKGNADQIFEADQNQDNASNGNGGREGIG